MVDIDDIKKSTNKIRNKIKDSIKDDGTSKLTLPEMTKMLSKFKELT